MRLYLKAVAVVLAGLSLMVAWPGMVCLSRDLRYDLHVACIRAFGKPADMEQLIDDTARALAVRSGALETYERGRLYRTLLRRRLAEDGARGHLTDERREQIEAECRALAFQTPPFSPRNEQTSKPSTSASNTRPASAEALAERKTS